VLTDYISKICSDQNLIYILCICSLFKDIVTHTIWRRTTDVE